METEIFSYLNIRLTRSEQADDELALFVSKTILGTPGRMRYAHTAAFEKIKNLKNAWYFKLKIRNTIIGSIVFIHRKIRANNKEISALYVRYFSINAPLRSETPDAQKDPKSTGILKNFITKMFEKPHEYVPSLQPDEPLVMYAYVDTSNIRSQMMVHNMDMHQVGTFDTFLFARRFPKVRLKLEGLKIKDLPVVSGLLQTRYQGYQFLETNLAIDSHRHYVYRKRDEILLSFTAVPNQWVVHEMPGITGKLIQRVLPFLPWFRRMLEKGRIDFIAVEHLYCKAGHEHLLARGFETVCAMLGHKKLLFWADQRCPINRAVWSKVDAGLLAKMVKFKPAGIFAKSYHEKNPLLSSKPSFVLAGDIT